MCPISSWDGSVVDKCESGGTGEVIARRFSNVRKLERMGPFNWNGGMRAVFAAAMKGITTVICSLNDDVSWTEMLAFRLLENERELMVRTWSSMAVFCSPFDGGGFGRPPLWSMMGDFDFGLRACAAGHSAWLARGDRAQPPDPRRLRVIHWRIGKAFRLSRHGEAELDVKAGAVSRAAVVLRFHHRTHGRQRGLRGHCFRGSSVRRPLG